MKIREMTKQVVEDQLKEAGMTDESVFEFNKQVLINFFYDRTVQEYVAKNKRKVQYIDLTLNIDKAHMEAEAILAELVKPMYKLSNSDFNKTLDLK